jgi:hypothetical protein
MVIGINSNNNMDRTTEIVCDFDSENSSGTKEALPVFFIPPAAGAGAPLQKSKTSPHKVVKKDILG